MYFSVLIIPLLGLLTYFDFKDRMVPIWLFISLGCVVGLQGVSNIPILTLIQNFGINVALILLLFIGVYVWFYIKNRGSVKLLDSYIGRGDIILMLISGLYFSPMMFVSFQVVSIAIQLIVFGLYIIISKEEKFTVPLAGGQAIILVVIELAKWFQGFTFCFRDDLILSYIMKFLW